MSPLRRTAVFIHALLLAASGATPAAAQAIAGEAAASAAVGAGSASSAAAAVGARSLAPATLPSLAAFAPALSPRVAAPSADAPGPLAASAAAPAEAPAAALPSELPAAAAPVAPSASAPIDAASAVTAAAAVVGPAAPLSGAAPDAGRARTAEAEGASGRILFDRAVERDGVEDGPAVAAAPGARPTLAALTERPSPVERRVLEKIAKELGPIAEPSDAPTLYAAIETIFGRLSAAQERLFPGDTVPVNRVRIIDTPVVNAFVYPIRMSGVRRSNNMVFITTGMLKKLLDADPAKLKEGLTRVAGVLAHELAHPLDDVDAQGVLTNYGREIGGQAREIRADSEGALIAKEAGYPVSAVHDFLARVFEGKSGREESAVEAIAGTHPQDDLRLVMQRILLTLNRYDRGLHVPLYPDAAPPPLLAELDHIDRGARAAAFAPPRDLAEALARLKGVPELDRVDDDKTVEFNRLLLSVDALLASRTTELDDEEFRRFTEIARVVAQSPIPVLDRAGMNRLFRGDKYAKEFLVHPTHDAYMKKIAAYRSPRYREWLAANFLTSELPGALQHGLTWTARIVPAQTLFEVFGDRIAARMPAALRSMHSRYVYENHFAEDKSVEFRVRLAVLFHRRVLPQLKGEERGGFFVGQVRDYSYVLPQIPHGRLKNRAEGLLTRRGAFLSDPRLGGLRDEYREVLRSVWENRGYYGTLDILAPFNRIDWNAIFAVLDIDPQVGYGRLRRGVKDFAGTPAYAELLRNVRDSTGDSFREARIGLSFGKDLGWLDDTLAPALSGDDNAALRADPELRAFGKKVLARAYYASRPELYRRRYIAALSAALAGGASAPANVEDLGRLHRAIQAELVGPGDSRPAFLEDALAKAIEDSPLAARTKRELLRAVFLEGYVEARRVNGLTHESAGDWLGDAARSPVVARVLVRQGLARDAADLLAGLLAREDFARKARANGFALFSLAASAMKTDLLSGLEAALARAPASEKAAVLTDFLAATVDPADGDYDAPEVVNTPELRELKERAAALAAPLDLSFAQSLAVFRRLTGTGATPATDAFFRARLEPAFDEDAAAAAGLPLAEILESKRISSGELQLALAQRVLAPEIARMEASGSAPSAADLGRLIETLNAYVRHGSVRKDEFLESLAWRLDITGRDLGAFIEDEKSYNWRKANPVLLRFGSGLGASIGRLSRRSREEFVRFLIHPQGGRLPDAILRELERNAYQEALRLNSVKDYPESLAQVRAQSDRAAYLIKLEIEAALIDATPFERIPLYELLLSAGSDALQKAPDYPYGVMRTFLGYEEGSKEEAMLAAFLAVVPEHERGVSLAYMLSQAGENKSSVKNLFEVFQTVGVKFGQMSSTWKLFGEEIARETASLKNDARPMTKAEIVETARRELTPEEFARIKRFVRVVGSASIKTVVLVELQDGREVVMMLRRPHAAEQIESNLRLGSDFLKELDRRGLGATSALFETVLDAVRRQLVGELSLTREAQSLRDARRHYERLNASMRDELGPWKFRVPQPIAGFAERDTILFVEKAEGETFDRLAPGVRAEVGPLIADSSLKALFRDGWFDADRHTGNQLVDAATYTIYPLDFGQAVDFSRAAFWRADDRYELAQFLRALSDEDAEGVLRRGLLMSDREPRDVDALRAKTREILAGAGGTQDRLVALVSAFAEQDAPLDDRFTFGAFKGLMTLAGENYLPDAEFRAALAREIRSLLRRKFPRTLRDGGAGTMRPKP